jgi:ribosome-binding protein aMBF1 (putative translation factor)
MRKRKVNAIIRAKRAEHGISQGQLALRVGTKAQYISNVERDLCQFAPKYLHKLSKAIKVNTLDLVDAYKDDYAVFIEESLASQVEEYWKV